MRSSVVRRRAIQALLLVAVLAPAVARAGEPLRRAFVTSVSGTGNLSSWPDAGGQTGLAAGDAICRARAAAAALPNAATFRAWLSTSTIDAFCHVLGLTGTKANNCDGGVVGDPPAGPWARTDGKPFAAKLSDVTSALGARVYQPLRFDETGADVPFGNAHAWTGTDAEGRVFASTCQDWTSASNVDAGDTGTAGGVGMTWTYDVTLDCDSVVRVICLEPGVGQVQRVPSTEGALAFLTSTSGGGDLSAWAGSGGVGGLTGADTVCRARAVAAKLPNPNQFRAWMSDSTTDAIERIWFLGPWVRVDGFPLAATRASMLGLSGKLLTGLNVDELGHYVTGTVSYDMAWTGTQYDGHATLDNCLDWTSASAVETAMGGEFGTARYFTWQSGGSPHCIQPHRLYCFSNLRMLFWDNFERGDALKWSAEVH